jgi:hypothetical protein
MLVAKRSLEYRSILLRYKMYLNILEQLTSYETFLRAEQAGF